MDNRYMSRILHILVFLPCGIMLTVINKTQGNMCNYLFTNPWLGTLAVTTINLKITDLP